MTAQAYFIITEDQKNALAGLAGVGHVLDAKLIDHPFASNIGASFDGLYALPASIVNDSGSDGLLPILASAQVHILDDALLFAPERKEEATEVDLPADTEAHS